MFSALPLKFKIKLIVLSTVLNLLQIFPLKHILQAFKPLIFQQLFIHFT